MWACLTADCDEPRPAVFDTADRAMPGVELDKKLELIIKLGVVAWCLHLEIPARTKSLTRGA